MATNTVLIPISWLQVLTGPQTGVAIQPRSGIVEYIIGTSLPGASDTGHVLRPEVGHTVTLATGENLYAQSIDQSGAQANLVITN
jgi:hypothetical protein